MKTKEVTSTPEYLLFGSVILLTLPAVGYFVLHALILSGRLDLLTLRQVGANAFGLSLIAPFTTIAAAPLLLILWFGGRRVWLKMIATAFLAAAGWGLVLFPVSKGLGGGPSND